jgi:hypothetical protein
VEPIPDTLTGPLATLEVDRSRERPVDDRTFHVYMSLLSYDKTDLKASVDSVTDAPHWPVLYFGGAYMLFARTPD